MDPLGTCRFIDVGDTSLLSRHILQWWCNKLGTNDFKIFVADTKQQTTSTNPPQQIEATQKCHFSKSARGSLAAYELRGSWWPAHGHLKLWYYLKTKELGMQGLYVGGAWDQFATADQPSVNLRMYLCASTQSFIASELIEVRSWRCTFDNLQDHQGLLLTTLSTKREIWAPVSKQKSQDVDKSVVVIIRYYKIPRRFLTCLQRK